MSESRLRKGLDLAGRPPAAAALLAAIGAATLFFRLGGLPFLGADEPRYARIAEEMSARGDWVTPHLEGRPWLEKPPLYYWVTIASYRLFGTGEASARAGSALLALASAASLYWLGARLWSPLAGLLGGAVLLSSLGFAAFGRSASTDMPLTACLTISLALLGGAALRRSQPAWQTLAAYFFLGLAVLAKGPVAPVLAAGILCLFWLLDPEGDAPSRWLILPGLGVAALVAAPWFWLVFRENGYGFIAVFFINHNLARFITDIHHHSEPFWYYLPVLAGLLLPWSVWLLLLARRPRGRLRDWDRGKLFLACWAGVPLVFFSLSSSKLPGYVLPVLPPAALALGAAMARWIEIGLPRGRVLAAAWTHAVLSLSFSAVLPVVFQNSYGLSWVSMLPVSAAGVLPALAALLYARRRDAVRAVAAILCQGILVVITLTQCAYPALGRYHSTHEIALRLQVERRAGEGAVTFRFFHHTLHYYTGYGIAADLTEPDALIRMLQSGGTLLVVAEAHRLPEIAALPGVTLTPIFTQGKLRLVRAHAPPSPAEEKNRRFRQ